MHTAPIENGVAIFRSTEWPFDMQGRFPITITNAESVSRSYYRTLIEAGTVITTSNTSSSSSTPTSTA